MTVTGEVTYTYVKGQGWIPNPRGPYRKSYKVLVQTLDPTVQQFKNKPPYHLGRGSGFLTKKPSKRARELMKRMLWQ